MDAVIFGIIAIVLTILSMYKGDTESPAGATTSVKPEDTTRTTKLNDSYYEDDNAFTEISSALGFPKSR